MYKIALILHLLGATIWTGGHIVLSAAVLPRSLRERDPEVISRFEEGFERIGIPALLVQVLTGLWLAHRLLPDPLEWFSFASYVHTQIALKVLLLVVTLGLAIDARLRIIPRLTAESLPSLAWHIVAVTAISIAFVLIGAGFRTGGLI